MTDKSKRVKLKVRATKKGDIEVSFSGGLDLDRLVDKVGAGLSNAVGDAFSELSGDAKKASVALRSKGKKVVPVQVVDNRGVPDLTEEEKAKREPPLTRIRPSEQGPRMCPVCKVRLRDCAASGRHGGGDLVGR